MLQFTYSERFQKHYKKLSVEEKNQLKRKLQIFSNNPFHPSLRTKRIQGTDELLNLA